MLTIIVAIIVALAAIAVFAILPDGTDAKWMNALRENSEPEYDLRTLPKPRFPSIEGTNIDGLHFRLPNEFQGLYNIVLIAYDKDQQRDVDEWLPHLRSIEVSYPDIRVYELPVVRELPWFQREQLEFWMSSDITDPKTRATTITLYTDVQNFNWILKIPNQSEINVALVDRFGNVMWQERGQYTGTKVRNLDNHIANLLANIRIYVEN